MAAKHVEARPIPPDHCGHGLSHCAHFIAGAAGAVGEAAPPGSQQARCSGGVPTGLAAPMAHGPTLGATPPPPGDIPGHSPWEGAFERQQGVGLEARH